MYRYISLLTASLSIVYSLPIAMSKRKTKQQKIIADLRRKVQVNQPIDASKTSSKNLETIKHTSTFTFTAPRNVTTQNAFASSPQTSRLLAADLQKTGIVTSIIIIAEVILFFLLKQHIITIPMVNY